MEMFASITFEWNDGGTIQRTTRQFATLGVALSAEALLGVWEQVGYDLQGDFALNMVGEGNLAFMTTAVRGAAVKGFGGSGGWAPLAESTVQERERKGFGGEHPILWRTGALGESLSTRGAPGNVFELSPQGVMVGTEIPYAAFHQAGTGKMPSRPIVGLTGQRQSAIVDKLNQYVLEQVHAAALDG